MIKGLEKENNPQERLWLLENYALIQYSSFNKPETLISSEINELKSKGYISLQRNVDYFINQKHKEVKILPTEALRNQGKTRHFGGIKPENKGSWESLQFIRFIEESSLILKHKNCYWQGLPENKIYEITNELRFKYTPISLCYSFVHFGNHSNENHLRKVFQDIIFNPEMNTQYIDIILKQFIKNFFFRMENNKSIREYLFIIAELMRVTEYVTWKDFWNTLWKGITEEGNIKLWDNAKHFFRNDNAWGWSIPIQKILRIIDDSNTIENLINYFITAPNLSDNYLQSLIHNPHFEEGIMNLCNKQYFKDFILNNICIDQVNQLKLEQIFRKDNSNKFEDIYEYLTDECLISNYDGFLIEALQNKEEYSVDIFQRMLKPNTTYKSRIMTVFHSLSESMKNDISNRITGSNLENYTNELLISLSIFLRQDCTILEYVSNSFFNYLDSLPNNSYPASFPSQYFLLNTNSFLKDETKIKIYKMYNDKWNNIKCTITDNYSFLGEIDKSNLIPFLNFFRKNKDLLIKIDGYTDFINELETYEFKIKGIESNLSLVLSSDMYQLIDLTTEIVNNISNNNNKYRDLMKYIMFRISLIDNLKNETILRLIVILLHNNKDNSDLLLYYLETVLLILNKYKTIPEIYDKIYIHEMLIRIAEYYRDLSDDDIIDYWVEVKNSSPYYEIKNLNQLLI